jgi:chromosome segregation protein
VEAVLGERLGAILVDDSAVSVEAVQFLKEGKRGRSVFLPLDAPQGRAPEAAAEASREPDPGAGDDEIRDPGVRGAMLDLVRVNPTYRDIAGHLFSDVVIVDTLPQAIELRRRLRHPRTVVTLEGEVIDALGLITGGTTDGQGASVLAQKREIRELTEICADLQRHHDEVHERLINLKEEVAAGEAEQDELRRTLHASDMTLLSSSKDLDALRDQIADVDRRADQAQREGERLAELIADHQERQGRDEEELTGLLVTREKARIALAQVQETAGAHRLDVENLTVEVSDLKVTAARAAEKRQTATREVARLEHEVRTARQRLLYLRESAATSATRIEELARAVETANAERLELASSAMSLSRRLADDNEACARRRAGLDEAEVTLRSLREDHRHLGDRREAARMALLELEKDWERLAGRLDERHHVAPGALLHEFHQRPLFSPEHEERLAAQQKVLESLRATYNPSARQEYEELNERFTFLSTQRKDLEDALERLDQAIQKINKASRQRFRETFEGINAEFQLVFPRLFRGGRASLTLTDSPDVLKAGVDIQAQPPGKKNQSVDLLSGGEKALTAVALLFAIFRYKPSPFCLLDEVDAPLDDTNVDRFNEIVREMARETQFIVITHNKRTMAVADELYGVTMEQPGCSKLVQVNFREASRLVDPSGEGGKNRLKKDDAPKPEEPAAAAAPAPAPPAPPARPETPPDQMN